MAKKVFTMKMEPTTIGKLKKKGKRLIKEKKFDSVNHMVESVLTKFADASDDYEQYYQ